MGVELGHHSGRWHVGESRGRPGLWGDHQPVGVPVPSNGEEPLGLRGVPEPAQPQLEEARRDGAVGEMLTSRPRKRAPAHQPGATGTLAPSGEALSGLDVEAAQAPRT